MKFSVLAVAALASVEAFAPTNKPLANPRVAPLEATKNDWWVPMATSFAAMTLAGQVAAASIIPDSIQGMYLVGWVD